MGVIHERADIHAAITTTGLNITTWIPPHQRGQQKPLNGNYLAYIQLSELDGGEERKGAWHNTSACAKQTQHDCNLHLTTINFRSKA